MSENKDRSGIVSNGYGEADAVVVSKARIEDLKRRIKDMISYFPMMSNEVKLKSFKIILKRLAAIEGDGSPSTGGNITN